MATHVVSLQGRFTESGTEFAVIQFIPKPNAGNRALTSISLTVTIDLARSVVTKNDEFVTDENQNEEVFDDIPLISLYEYTRISGTNVLTGFETIRDERLTYGTPPEVPAADGMRYQFAPYQKHESDTFTRLMLNPPLSASEFMLPRIPR